MNTSGTDMNRELKNFRDEDNDELSVIKWSDGTATFSVMARNGVVRLNAEQVQELIECLEGANQ